MTKSRGQTENSTPLTTMFNLKYTEYLQRVIIIVAKYNMKKVACKSKIT